MRPRLIPHARASADQGRESDRDPSRHSIRSATDRDTPHEDLVTRFGAIGPRAVQAWRSRPGEDLAPWPASGGMLCLEEALRIVLLEATVHLLDVQRALDLLPDVPAAAIAETVSLLVDMVRPVDLVEVGTGRAAPSPFPVIR